MLSQHLFRAGSTLRRARRFSSSVAVPFNRGTVAPVRVWTAHESVSRSSEESLRLAVFPDFSEDGADCAVLRDSAYLKALDCDSYLSAVVKEEGYSAKKKKTVSVRLPLPRKQNAPAKVAILGMGPLDAAQTEEEEEDDAGSESVDEVLPKVNGTEGRNRLQCLAVERSRQLGTSLVSLMQSLNLEDSDTVSDKQQSVVVELPSNAAFDLGALVESLSLSAFNDRRYYRPTKKDTDELRIRGDLKLPALIDIVSADASEQRQRVRLAESLSRGVVFARQLVNSPACILTPEQLAKSAESIARDSEICSVDILDKAACEKLQMGAFLAVGEASANEPKFIHMKLGKAKAESAGKRKLRVAVIGKGVCFDSGGYNLKVGAASSIHQMKYDMAGAAAVLGAVSALSDYWQQGDDSGVLDAVDFHFCVAACENLVSGKSGVLRPGDVVQAANGSLIEVKNTDAEGRLTLADAICYSRKVVDADVIVDVATLTGAMKVANGHAFAGYFANSELLADCIEESSQLSGDSLWRYPLYGGYKDCLKSKVADLSNTGAGADGAGAITAALFLQHFAEDKRVSSKVPHWAHVDVAGTAWRNEQTTELHKAGATGYGVRLLSHLLLNASQFLTK